MCGSAAHPGGGVMGAPGHNAAQVILEDLKAAVIFYGQNPPLDDVPRIGASVLGLYGAEDPGITGTVPLLAEAMKRAGKNFDSHVYAGAKHAFFNDTRPNYNRDAAVDAWERVGRFLQTNLGN